MIERVTSRLAWVLMLATACSSRPPGATRVTDISATESAPRLALPIAIAPETPKPKREGAYANLDPDDDLVVGPPDLIDDCEGKLTKAGVTFRAAPIPVYKHGKIECGAPQVVTFVKGPGAIAYSAPPQLTCGMALALAQFETIAQEEATKAFGVRIARIDQLGTFSCREMQNYPGWVSEHSYANALDIGRFVLADGRTAEVLHDFDQRAPTPTKPAPLFLRNVSRRANDEDVFSHVLTPFFDKLHANHFHLDLARYRNDGTRPRN